MADIKRDHSDHNISWRQNASTKRARIQSSRAAIASRYHKPGTLFFERVNVIIVYCANRKSASLHPLPSQTISSDKILFTAVTLQPKNVGVDDKGVDDDVIRQLDQNDSFTDDESDTRQLNQAALSSLFDNLHNFEVAKAERLSLVTKMEEDTNREIVEAVVADSIETAKLERLKLAEAVHAEEVVRSLSLVEHRQKRMLARKMRQEEIAEAEDLRQQNRSIAPPPPPPATPFSPLPFRSSRQQARREHLFRKQNQLILVLFVKIKLG